MDAIQNQINTELISGYYKLKNKKTRMKKKREGRRPGKNTPPILFFTKKIPHTSHLTPHRHPYSEDKLGLKRRTEFKNHSDSETPDLKN